MALRKSPVRTAAMLAANRANAKKCTGPSTAEGKARVALNALKHGRRADRLPEKLPRAGDRERGCVPLVSGGNYRRLWEGPAEGGAAMRSDSGGGLVAWRET